MTYTSFISIFGNLLNPPLHMKKIFLFTIVAIIISLGMSHAQVFNGAEAMAYVKNAESVAIRSDDYLPSFIKFSQGKELNLSELTGWMGENFKLAPGFGLKLLKSEMDQLGYSHYRYQQTINGYPVVGGDYVVHVKNNKIVSMNGSIRKYIEPNTQITISESAALQSALDYVNANQYMWEIPQEESLLKTSVGSTDASFYPKGDLYIVPLNGDFSSEDFRLAYKFDIYAKTPLSRQFIYVDAISGEIVMKTERIHTTDTPGTAVTKYNGNQTITADSYNGSFRLRETGRGLGIETYDMNEGTNYGSAVDFTDADNYWNNVNAAKDEVATDAHWGAEMTYDYFFTKFGRNSLDNAGMKLLSYVHYDAGYNNAFWDGLRMTYGDGSGGYSPFTALDICGHEITHGLDENTANLVYQDESGAMNEGFSDIFGTAIEFYAVPASANWTMGEDIGAVLRNLSNPNANSLPDTYLGTYWYTGTADNGGVHTNSGVLGYWFYLLSQGGTGTNDNGDAYNVTGITKDKAAAIAYRTLAYYLTSASEYADARTYSILACQDLYGGCSPEAQSNQNAWYAVGIGAAWTSTPATADFAACPATTCNNAPFDVQFTNLSTNGNTFKWYFGDGTTSTLSSPLHTYSTNGTYNVKLVAYGGTCGSDSITINDFVQVGPSYQCTVFIPGTGNGTTQTSCDGTIYDSGICGDYADNTNGTMTLSPAGATSITLTFSAFNFENNYDYLYVYDGNSTAAAQFAGSPFTGGTIPVPFVASGGSITLKQTSDGGVTSSGFVANWSCASSTLPPVAGFSADNTSSCTGLISFTDLSTNGPTSWLWDFGDGQTSTDQNPSYIYTASGTYTVTLTATNSYGSDQVLITDYVTINLPLAPTTTNDTICGSGSASLSASGNGTLNWYDAATGGNIINTGNVFNTPTISTSTTYYVEDSIQGSSYNCAKPDNSGGGGYTSTGDHYLIFDCSTPVTLVSVTIYGNTTAPGNRTIELRNSSGAVLQSSTQNILSGTNTYTLNFEVPAGTDLRLGCEGTNIYRNNASVAYPYSLPGYISVKGSDAGAAYYYYFYDWVIQDPSCISSRSPVTAIVNTGPSAGITIADNPSGPICAGTSVDFTATPVNGGTAPTYQWMKNGSAIAGATNSTYTTSNLTDGDAITCEITSNESCISGNPATSNEIIISVSSAITAGVSIVASPSGTICVGSSVTLTATATNGGSNPSYQWQLNSSDISGATNSTYTSSAFSDGDIVTCMMASDLSCATGSPATSNSIAISMVSSMTSAILISANPGVNICTGNSVTFNATPYNGGSSPAYQWFVNGNPAGTNNSVFTSSSLQDNDSVTCQLTSSEGCVSNNPAASNTLVINIITGPPASISIDANPNTGVCTGTSVTFDATAANGGTNPIYQWQINGSNVGTNSSTYAGVLNDGDIVTCVVISSLNCVSNNPATSNIFTATVYSNPSTPFITQSGDTLISSSSSGNQWYYDDGSSISPIPGAVDQTYNPTADGYYFSIVTDSNGCVSDTSNALYYLGVGINSYSSSGIIVYPIPANNLLTIRSTHNGCNYTLSIENMLGQQVYSGIFSGETKEMNLSSLSEGLYLLKINDGQHLTVKKFIVER